MFLQGAWWHLVRVRTREQHVLARPRLPGLRAVAALPVKWLIDSPGDVVNKDGNVLQNNQCGAHEDEFVELLLQPARAPRGGA